MLELIQSRRSIRSYTESSVSAEHIEELLKAAMAAPSAMNLRPWAFVVVQDRDLRMALAKTHQYSPMCASAPVVFVVLGQASARHWVEDCSAATENLLLAATGLGLGAVWIGVYPGEEQAAGVRNLLDIPDEMRVLALVAVGHPAEDKPARTQYEAHKVSYERFGK
jgi:nitroreductase